MRKLGGSAASVQWSTREGRRRSKGLGLELQQLAPDGGSSSSSSGARGGDGVRSSAQKQRSAAHMCSALYMHMGVALRRCCSHVAKVPIAPLGRDHR